MNELNHIAIIMDGNGRWGLKKKGSRNYLRKDFNVKTLLVGNLYAVYLTLLVLRVTGAPQN